MRRHSLTLAIVLALVASLMATSGAQAVVVNDHGTTAGVALVPGTGSELAAAGITTPAPGASCSNPWLTSDLVPPPLGLCWHAAGAVMHGNETFALTWDPDRRYWETTRDYIEQFLQDVANGSGTLTSPYAVTSQYEDTAGRAGNASIYGGGCIDYGDPGGVTCQFGNTNGSGTGNNYGASVCTPSGSNDTCVTDDQIQGELQAMVGQTGMLGRIKPGYTPLVVVLIPSNVEVCVDGAGKLCSAGSTATAQFCSYHSHVHVSIAGGSTMDVPYVVQPWTANTGCDEPNLPQLPSHPTAAELAIDAGKRIVNPLSQGQIAAIVNPQLNGWYANDGSEINDNDSCAPGGYPYDAVTVGGSSQNPYYLQPEFNDTGLIETDPNAPACALGVALEPTFVIPSAVNQGDEVEFDGSTTVSTLIVPKAYYVWRFGDGTSAIGPSVVHTYAKGGTYTVTLSVGDRGGNVRSLSQTLVVLGATGNQVTGHAGSTPLRVHLQLLPQGLKQVLRSGIAVRVSANEVAAGFASLWISHSAAKRAHINAGRGGSVVIGRGTVSGIKDGTVRLRLRLSGTVAAKLRRLRHVTLTVRLALVAAGGDHSAIDAAGRY